ncbi:MAG: ATP-binding protein [Spirochaetia bacterium]|jgi:hypothetical protein|nr:ATP-binding protein [Spirochaetia bacterium]
MNARKLPIGIQDFEGLRTDGYLYVDKTAYVFKMASEGKPYFLGRPRRFGKSLLISTLKAYFLGKKELFRGLALEGLEKDWVEHPVFHIDMNGENYSSGLAGLESGFNVNLNPLENIWGKEEADTTPSSRFRGLIRRACEKSGKKVVVLIDEYDKPLLETMDDPQLNKEVRKELKAFYGVLKTADPWLRFVLLTGVTKFSQVSVFSDLNHLRDISMEKAYAGICGVSAAELTENFQPELHALAEDNGMGYGEAVAEMHKRYNGYHFAGESEGMFNPFSVLNTFAGRQFNYYWFRTGTPTFLVEALKKTGFDLRALSGGITIPAEAITDCRTENPDPTPILYQSGYLTIKDYDRMTRLYTLGFPNEEVEFGFLGALFPLYAPQISENQVSFVARFFKDLADGDVDAFMDRLRAFMAGIPYDLHDRTERNYQMIFYLVFTLLGQFAQTEVKSASGRADMVVSTQGTVYVFEFKLAGNGGAEEALKQIDGKGYLIPFSASGKRLVKIGVEFDAEKRNVGRWVVGGA